MKRSLLTALVAARTAKRSVVLATWLPQRSAGEPDAGPPSEQLVLAGALRQLLIDPHQRTLIASDQSVNSQGERGTEAASAADAADRVPVPMMSLSDAARQALFAAAEQAAWRDQSQRVEIDGDSGAESVFLRVYNPPLRLVIVGAVHIAQALSPMASLAGFAVTVVDPRTAFATAERFPGVTLVTDWPDRALVDLHLDQRTAVVTLTHDPKLDEPALIEALRSSAFYIGALGSTRTQAARLRRLDERCGEPDAGFDKAALARIHGPVGLDIGARGAAEIAIAVLAQIVARLRQPEQEER